MVCCAELLVTVPWTVVGLWRAYSPRFSPSLARHRLQLSTDDATDGLKGDTPIPALILLVRALAPLPQFIELATLNGVSWTQTWGTTYLTTFLITLIMMACERNDDNDDKDATSSNTKLPNQIAASLLTAIYLISKVSFGAQIGVWLWMMYKLPSQ